MSNYRWGRGAGHRIQHVWGPAGPPDDPWVFSLCFTVLGRTAATVDFESDAARCERCAGRVRRMKAEQA